MIEGKKDSELEEKNLKKKSFTNSAKYIKASFILGIVVLLLSVALVFEASYLYPIVKRLPDHLKKLPTYVNGAFILAAAVAGTILGGLSFRKERNIYGILGFILNLIVIGFVIYMFIATYRFNCC